MECGFILLRTTICKPMGWVPAPDALVRDGLLELSPQGVDGVLLVIRMSGLSLSLSKPLSRIFVGTSHSGTRESRGPILPNLSVEPICKHVAVAFGASNVSLRILRVAALCQCTWLSS